MANGIAEVAGATRRSNLAARNRTILLFEAGNTKGEAPGEAVNANAKSTPNRRASTRFCLI